MFRLLILAIVLILSGCGSSSSVGGSTDPGASDGSSLTDEQVRQQAIAYSEQLIEAAKKGDDPAANRIKRRAAEWTSSLPDDQQKLAEAVAMTRAEAYQREEANKPEVPIEVT